MQPIDRVYNVTRINIHNDRDYLITLNKVKPITKEIVMEQVKEHATRLLLTYCADFIVNGIALPDKYFHSSKDINIAIVLVEDEIDEKIDEVIRSLIDEHIDKFIEHCSDVVFVRSNWLEVKTARYNTTGSSYRERTKFVRS